jgi:hypothetical protein
MARFALRPLSLGEMNPHFWSEIGGQSQQPIGSSAHTNPTPPANRVLADGIRKVIQCHQVIVESCPLDDQLPQSHHVWLIGPVGSGKSHGVFRAVRAAGVPWMVLDLARFALPGQHGLQLEQTFQQLSETSPLPLRSRSAGVVVVEGLTRELVHGTAGERARILQAELSSLQEGRMLPWQRNGRVRKVSSRRLLFILMVSEDGPSSAGMGFRAGPGEPPQTPVTQRLLRAGVMPGLIHLSAHRLTTRDFTLPELEALVLASDGFLEDLHRQFGLLGARLEVSPEAAALLARQAGSLGPGGHGLRQAIAAAMPGWIDSLLQLPEGSNGIRLDRDPRDPSRLIATPLEGPRGPLAPRQADTGEEPAIHPDFPRMPHRPSRPAHVETQSESRLANRDDLRKWTQPPKPSKGSRPEWKPTRLGGFIALHECSPDGSRLAPLVGHDLFLSQMVRRRGLLISGGTGGGKSTRLVLPLIYSDINDPERTVVVLDAQLALVGPIIDYTRHVRGKDARIVYFNPMDPAYSVRWNPAAGVSGRNPAHDLASSLSASLPVGRNDTGYFRSCAVRLLASLIRLVHKMGKGNLGEAYSIIEAGGPRLVELGQDFGFPDLAEFGRDMNQYSNHATTAEEMKNMLGPWYLPEVCQVTERSELDFQQLEDQPTVFIIALPEESVARLRPLTNCLIHRLFEFVIRRGQAKGGVLRRPMAIHIDEFGSAVGAIVDLHVRANTLRKRGVMLTAATQCLNQLFETYPDNAKSLLAAFSTHIYVPQLASDDASHVSERSGLTEVVSTTTGPNGEVLSSSPQTRAVLLPTEVDRPPVHPKYGPRMTFLLPETPVFQGYLPAVWENPQLADMVAPDRPFTPPGSPRKAPADPEASSIGYEPAPPARGQPMPSGALVKTWSDAYVKKRWAQVQQLLSVLEARRSSRIWWDEYLRVNRTKPRLLLKLGHELVTRSATLQEFHDAVVASNSSNTQAALHYLDYLRAKNLGPHPIQPPANDSSRDQHDF